MKIDINRQKEAQEKIKRLLEHEEQQRVKRRILKLVAKLESGDSADLLNDELMENLPGLVSAYCDAGERDRLHSLFEKLGDCACSEDSSLRERAIMALSLSMVGLGRKDHPDLVKSIVEIILRWLRVEPSFLSVCDTVCKQLQEYGVEMLEEGLWGECEYLLEVFYQIQSGILVKNNAIRGIVGRSQEAMATDYLLKELTLVCLHGRGNRRQKAERTLIHLGRKAATHLLETLLNSKEKEDRMRLIGLIPATGYVAGSVLTEYLQRELPWYGVRNIVLMIAAMDDESLVPAIMPCLKNNDIRIQQQVIDCICEVVETNPGSYLLEALPIVNDELKPALVGYIGQLGLSEATEAFLDLLSQRDTFSSSVKDKLLVSLAIQTRLSDSIRAVRLLEMILEERKVQHPPESDPVARVVGQSLHILKPRFVNTNSELIVDDHDHVADTAEKSIPFVASPVSENHVTEQTQEINDEIVDLLGKNLITDARQLLYEKCMEAVKEKQFQIAELLRDRILEVDPSALADVIKADEIIEEEQAASIAKSHISIWQDLYDSMTTEEFDALYNALENVEYESGSVIVEQGDNNPLLYFVNSGNISLTCRRGDDEVFLKKIGPGEIVGAGPFFDVSIWTVSLNALGKTDVQTLARGVFLELLEPFPGLEPCILNYCLKAVSVPELLKMSGEDRRQHPRYPMKIIVEHTLLNQSGEKSNRVFKGEVADISAGGLTFFIKVSSKENSRLLLGRGIKTTLLGPGGKVINCVGQIVAVRLMNYVESEYSVHVRFNDPLLETLVKSIINSN